MKRQLIEFDDSGNQDTENRDESVPYYLEFDYLLF